MEFIDHIKMRLASLTPHVLEIIDESHKHAGHSGSRPEGNTHFKIIIISDHFKNLSRIDRHKLVYDSLKQEVKDIIHALTITAYTLEEYKK
jgi:BolA protein